MEYFRQLLIKWIIVNDLPFTSVESSDFKNLISILRSGVPIPCADTLKNNIIISFNENKKNIQQFLQVIILY